MSISIAGEFGTGNPGDNARLVLLRHIAGPLTRITVIGRPGPADGLIPSTSYRDVTYLPNLYHSTPPSRDKFFRGLNHGDSTIHLRQIHDAIESSSILVIGGGNLILDLSIGVGRGLLTQYLEFARLARFCQTPILLYGITIGPLESELGIDSARLLLELADEILVLDRESQVIAETLVGRRVDRVVDHAAVLAVVRPGPPTDSSKKYLLCSPRDMMFLGPDTRELYERHFALVVSEYILRSGQQALFVPHEIQEASDLDVYERILSFMHPLARQSSEVAGHTDNFETVYSWYASAQAVLTSRFHGAVFSLASGVPVLSVSHLPKAARLFSDAGIPSHDCNATQFPKTSIDSLLNRLRQSASYSNASRRFRDSAEQSAVVYEESFARLRSLG